MKTEIAKSFSLKEKLDEIDREVFEIVKNGFYQSHFKKNIGMWEKGEAIAGFTPPKTAVNWSKLGRQVGRDREDLKKWHDFYRKYPDKQKYIEEYAEPMATKALERYLKTQAVLQSGTPEWWTPKKYIDAVHKVMGDIDLDPASCEEANKTVMAKQFYSPEDDGLSKEWEGRVFLNPPYGEEGPPFIEKLYNSLGPVTQAIILVNSRSTDAEWFQPLFDGVVCFTDHRIDFNSSNEKETSSTHGSCFIYFGPNKEKFAEVFKKFGNTVKTWP